MVPEWLQFCCINTPPKHSSLQMKMPGSVGTKKAKAVEQLLEELGVGMWELLSNISLPKYQCSRKERGLTLKTRES